MIEEILDDEKFALLMKMHVYECIDFLLQRNINFSIMANLPLVSFEPELPAEIKAGFNMPVIIFTLAGYTFESTRLSEDSISFEAGFGAQDYASLVSLPLGAIVQILVENSPILVNFSIHKSKTAHKDHTEKSISAFMSNPQNKDIFKKKK